MLSLREKRFRIHLNPSCFLDQRAIKLIIDILQKAGTSYKAIGIFNPMDHRSSHQRCFVRKGVLRNFAKFTGRHLCQSFFLRLEGLFSKVAGLRPATLLKKRLWHRCFRENFAKFLRTPFLQNTSGRLLLEPGNMSGHP